MQEPQAHKPLRVLIIEDSEDDAFLILRELRKGARPLHHERVYTTLSLETALASEQWDLVLSDYNLPGFTALDVLQRVQARNLDLPVIIVSGAIGEELAVNAMHAGAHDYIMKDNLARLNPAIERELHEMEVHRQRLAAEEALRKSEHSLANAQRIAHVGSWEWDIPSGRIAWSDEVFRIFGVPTHEAPPTYEEFLASIHPDDRSHVVAAIEAALKGDSGYNVEHRVHRADGAERVVHELGEVRFDDAGAPISMVGVVHDISERKAAEEALRESEARFQQLATNLEEVLWLIDIEAGHMVYVSPAFELIWERPSAPLLHNYDTFLETIHPEDYSRVEQRLVADGWIAFNDEYRIQRPDGSERWISTRSFPIRDTEGEVHRVAGISSDITERKRLETEMKKLSRALEQTADAVMVTDREGTIEYVNSAFEDITGYGRDEVIGGQPSILKSGLMEPEFYGQLWKSVVNGVPFTDIFINRRKNGDLFYEAKTVTPVRDEQGDVTHFVSTGKDITERLRRQEHFQRMVNHDVITGLPNRELFVERLNEALPHAERLGLKVGVFHLALDLSGLLGEVGGSRPAERLSRIVARRLKETIAHHELVAALDGESFLAIRKFVPNLEDIEAMAQEIAGAFAHPLVADGYELHITPSIGISVYPEDGEEPGILLQKARVAALHGGPKRRMPYVFYEGSMSERPVRHLSS